MAAATTARLVQPGTIPATTNSERLIEALLDTHQHTPADRAACRRGREYPATVSSGFVYVGVIEPLDNTPLNVMPKGSKAIALEGPPVFSLPTLHIQEGCDDAVVDLVKLLDSSGAQFVVSLPRGSARYGADDLRYIKSRILAECSGNVSIRGVEQ
jgi:hypothetical protein